MKTSSQTEIIESTFSSLTFLKGRAEGDHHHKKKLSTVLERKGESVNKITRKSRVQENLIYHRNHRTNRLDKD